tara:strand:- start:1235 stop:1588 length:354 start_codon:yes stop_codon:yes gene_type:complete
MMTKEIIRLENREELGALVVGDVVKVNFEVEKFNGDWHVYAAQNLRDVITDEWKPYLKIARMAEERILEVYDGIIGTKGTCVKDGEIVEDKSFQGVMEVTEKQDPEFYSELKKVIEN